MGGAGPLFLSQSECLANPRRHAVAADDLPGEFGQWPHHVDHVDNLELALLGALDRLLAGDHHHRHGAKLGVGGGGDQIGGTGAKGGEADTGLAGQAAVGGGHKAGGLLMAGDHQFDLRSAQGFEQVEVLFSGDGKDVLDPFRFQGTDEQVRGFHCRLHQQGHMVRHYRPFSPV